ncbi:calponin homology domain-containing protein [Spinellus fusiger]|nr:calponin homology domain-containing protein [Spinellus fusiger]
MDKAWEAIQQKTFTKWVNIKLDIKDIPHIRDLCNELALGVRLIQLLEIISNTPIVRYNKNPRMRIQCVENVNMALEFIQQRGVALTNIGAEDIVDKNLKLVLGMLWTIILRFTIADINQEGKNAKEGLLLWCQRKTAPYKEVNVRDFTYSWTDGLAFCALIHRHRPDLLDFYSLDPNDRHGNTALAFDIAETHLGIPKLLDVEDVCDISKPDERSVMTYVAEYFHAFSALDKVETAGRRIAKFAEVMSSLWQMQHAYEQRVLALMDAVDNAQQQWKMTALNDSYADMKQLGVDFNNYKNTLKREWVSEKRDIDFLLGNIQTKLKTYNLKPYYPPEGLTLRDLDNVWHGLLKEEASFHQSINSRIRRIKENLRKAYANAANEFQKQLDIISNELASLDGDLNHQLGRLESTKRKMDPIHKNLHTIELLDQECSHANTEENDYTVYSIEDLTFGLGLVQQAIQKKNAFIQNQIVSRNMTNLTPAQLEEFEQAFRHFDNDASNTLSAAEFNAALASLGIFFEDPEFESLFDNVSEGREEATFEQFIRFMVSVTEDKSTPEQLHDSFRTISGEKPYITELDLKMCLVPMPVIDYLKHTMPSSREETDAMDYNLYIMQTFK